MAQPNKFSPTMLNVGIFSVAGCCLVIVIWFALLMSPWASEYFSQHGWRRWIWWGVIAISGNALPICWLMTLAYFMSHRNLGEGGPSSQQITLLRIVLALPFALLVLLMVLVIVEIASIERWN